MTNLEIITILEEMGKIKEVLGENYFKVAAYERAGRSLRNLGENLEDIYQKKGAGGLQEISGIGEAIAGHIKELVEKGKCKEYEQLKKKVPAAILEFVKIPGVGVKTAQKMYKTTKTKSIKELKSRITNHESRIRDKFSEKSLKNILRGIKILSKQTKRITLSQADIIAERVTVGIGKITTVSCVTAAGSLRRRCDTVGDIDIVCASKNPRKVIEEFIKLPFVDKIIDQGDTKASIIDKISGREIDLEVLPLENYGSLLHHFTGSKDHNVHLRAWAEEKGMSVSEYGIKSAKRKAQSAKQQFKIQKISNEKLFYKYLGMDYIVPELREDRGEIEAALKHKLPNSIELKDIKGDLQMHTTDSDGENTLEEITEAAMALGYQYIAVTDHSAGLGVAGGQSDEQILSGIKKIKDLNKKFKQQRKKFQILAGIEANINARGDIDVSNEILSQLDIVVASIHSGFNQSKEKMTVRIIRALKNPYVTILAHPTGRLIPRRPGYEADWNQIFTAAKKNNVILEINAFPDRLDLPDYLAKTAKEKYGLKFAIDTDAHHRDHLKFMKYGVSVARRAWLEKYDIINTCGLDNLIKLFRK